jgi:hypothetical protein
MFAVLEQHFLPDGFKDELRVFDLEVAVVLCAWFAALFRTCIRRFHAAQG